MVTSCKFRQSLPLAKREGNEQKLRQQLTTYKVGRLANSIKEERANYEWSVEMDFFENRYRDLDDHYDPLDWCDYRDDLPLAELRQIIEHPCVRRSPFSELSNLFSGIENREPQTRLADRVMWYEVDDSLSLDCDMLAERLKAYFINDEPGEFETAVARLSVTAWEKQQLQALLILFRPFWIRRPSSWSGGSQESLLRHLLVRYDVPAFLFGEWQNLDASLNNRFVWNLWFIMLGQGVKLGQVFEKLAKKYDQCLFRISEQFADHFRELNSPRAFAMAAEARRIGASDATILRLTRNAAYRQNPNDMEPAFGEFFERTIKWLETYGSDLQEEQVDSVLTWAHHLYTVRLRDLQQALVNQGSLSPWGNDRVDITEIWLKHRKNPRLFSWRGRTAMSACAAAQRYRRQLEMLRDVRLYNRTGLLPSTSWSSQRVDFSQESFEDTWTIVELCSVRELLDEGDALSHCVASYAKKCVVGQTAIFSLRKNGQRKITIEIDCRHRRMVQALGRGNRRADHLELTLIDRWLSAVGLA